MRNEFISTIHSEMARNKNIVFITGDLGFGVLDKIAADYPSRFINAGICEQNMTSLATGMALRGKIVFTYSIGNFATLRCLEQIRNGAAYHDCNINIVSVGGGFSYGSLGMSHHATEDIAIMRALPNVSVFTPCDACDAQLAAYEVIRIPAPCYIRLGKGGEPDLPHDRVRKGDGSCGGVAILAAGAIAMEAFAAADALSEEGINCTVVPFAKVKPLDEGLVREIAQTHEYVFTLEEHNIVGGFGGAVAEVIAETGGAKARLKRLGLCDTYSSIVGDQNYLREYYGLDAAAVVAAVKGAVT